MPIDRAIARLSTFLTPPPHIAPRSCARGRSTSAAISAALVRITATRLGPGTSGPCEGHPGPSAGSGSRRGDRVRAVTRAAAIATRDEDPADGDSTWLELASPNNTLEYRSFFQNNASNSYQRAGRAASSAPRQADAVSSEKS